MKKAFIISLAIILLLAVLFVPIPSGTYRDGGTKTYTALTYKIVHWNRASPDGITMERQVYWFPDNFKSLDELWAVEEQKMYHSFTATIVELDGDHALLEPVEENLCDRISINTAKLADIGAEVGCQVKVSYMGGIMESYPAQVRAVKWELVKTDPALP